MVCMEEMEGSQTRYGGHPVFSEKRTAGFTRDAGLLGLLLEVNGGNGDKGVACPDGGTSSA